MLKNASLNVIPEGHAYVGCPQVKASGADDSCIFRGNESQLFRGFVVYCT